MKINKETPQLGLSVLAKLGAAIRDGVDAPGEARLSPRMRSLLAKLKGAAASTNDQGDAYKNSLR
jgi:hypothetical protein